jgi:Radical SAM superfamily
MIRVPKLEMHLAYGCNLRCENCCHYSDYRPGGLVPLAEGSDWLKSWSIRLEPVNFSLLGGEPLLNPEVPAYIKVAREQWPHTKIRLVTNGLLLPRTPLEFWRTLAETEATLTVSIHSRDGRYLDELSAALACAQFHAREYDFRLETRNSVDGWYRTYRGHGPGMTPFQDGDPRSSWRACPSKHCLTLEGNAIWKCPPLAHFPRIAHKFRLDLKPEWEKPLRYVPLTLDATDDEVRAFVGRGEEPVCGMCPASPAYFEKAIR